MRRWVAAVLAAMTVGGSGPAAAAPAGVDAYMAQPQVAPAARIAYGAAPAQVVELFLPKGRGPFPVVVLLHGGCFLAEYEGLKQTSGIAADLAARGYAVWNVEYRKLGEAGAGYPGTFLDVADAIDRIRAEAPRYKLDPKRVVALGHSAGGHLALWAASRAKLARSSPLWRADPLPIRGVVSLGGIGDLETHAGVFSGACGPTLAQVAPPRTYPETSPADLLPTGVPVTMIHGEFDHVMPPDSGQAYAAKVRAAGDEATAVEIKGVGHFEPVMPTTQAWKTVVVPAVARAFGKPALMRQRPLGRTGLSVSELGFGCASWWGKPRFDEATALGLVHQALDLGITLFDTGASYSAGEAEPRLGRALKGRDTAGLVVATKAGTYHAGGGRIARDMSPAAIVASAERSLRNLGLDALGLLQLHGPSVAELNADMQAALEALKARGLTRAVGLNSFDPAVIDHAIGLPVIDVVMVDYNVLRPEREPLIARAAAAGKGVLAGMPLAMGHTRPLLARLRGPQDLWYAARALAKHRVELARGRRFRFLHALPDMTGSQAALGYVLANPNVSAAVFGATRREHLADNAAAAGMPLPDALMRRIRAAQP